jgi:hypothetical protein
VVERVLKDLLFVALAKLFIKKWRTSHKDRGDDFPAFAEAMRPCLTNKCPFANLPGSRKESFRRRHHDRRNERAMLAQTEARGVNQFY